MQNRIPMEEKIARAKHYMRGRGWVSATEVDTFISGKFSYISNPVCKRMGELGMVERNAQGHYRLI